MPQTQCRRFTKIFWSWLSLLLLGLVIGALFHALVISFMTSLSFILFLPNVDENTFLVSSELWLLQSNQSNGNDIFSTEQHQQQREELEQIKSVRGKAIAPVENSSLLRPTFETTTTTTSPETSTTTTTYCLSNMDAQRPRPVVLWPNSGTLKARLIHIFLDGIEQSPYLQLITDWRKAQPDATWIVDVTKDGNEAIQMITTVAQERKSYHTSNYNFKDWRIVLVDYGDFALPKRFWLNALAVLARAGLEPKNIDIYIRSIAKGRKWNEETQWIEVGTKLDASLALPYHHAPFTVRTDTIQQLQAYLRGLPHPLELSDPMEQSLERAVDVTHLWPADQNGNQNNNNGQKVGNAQSGRLRFRVSQWIQTWGVQHGWKAMVGLAGVQTAHRGRLQAASMAYLAALTGTKIMVVTQRDPYEDHYRLMEALAASGACVFSDYMHGLPAGLENGTSIIVFTSPQELQSLIVYYLHPNHQSERLEIARRGREVAMTRHRSWHRMEEMVFCGRVPSTCSRRRQPPTTLQDFVAKCPWTVNATEAVPSLWR